MRIKLILFFAAAVGAFSAVSADHYVSPPGGYGTNESWMSNSTDLDGRIRIRYGTVDMGAYETIYEGSSYMVR